MASKRSCFNPTLLRKNLLRFWPCWAGPLLLAVLILPVGMARTMTYRMEYGSFGSPTAEFASEYTLGMLPIVLAASVVLGVLIPALLNRYLYTARSANFFHSLPIRREGLLITNTVSGLVMLWGPMILTAVITAFVELAFGVLDLLSLGQLLLFGLCTSLFFFSLGMLCMHLTGMLIAGLGLYVVLNGLAITTYLILSSLVELFVVGFSASAETMQILLYLTPIERLASAYQIHYYQTQAGQMAMLSWSDIGVAGAYALGGVCLLAVTLLLCLARKTERAGDLIAFGWLRPVFKVSFSVLGGGAMCLFTILLYSLRPDFWVTLLLTVVWSLLAWLVAEMMVQKSVKVFHKPVFARWSILAVCITLLFAGMRMDLFCIERRVPAPEKVASVTVSTAGRTAPGVDTEKVVALHQTIVDRRAVLREQDASDTASITFDYKLTDGSSLQRKYQIPCETSLDREDDAATLAQALYDFVADPEVAMAMAFDGSLEQAELTAMIVEYEIDDVNYTLDLNKAQQWQIYQAIETDIREGHFNYCSSIFYTSDLETVNTQITIHYLHETERKPNAPLYPAGAHSHWTGFYLTTQMTHTIACLQELGLPAEALLAE